MNKQIVLVDQLLEKLSYMWGDNTAEYKDVESVVNQLSSSIDSKCILVLPCEIGTTLYYVVPDESVTWPDDPEYKIITIAFRPDLIDEFGKKAFLTREEAEIARKEANKMEVFHC